MKVNRATITEATKFMRDLFNANKPGNKNVKNFLQVSEKFTPEEYSHLLGNNAEKVLSFAERWNAPFRAEVLNPETRTAILNMGSRSVYVDMLKTGRAEMDKIVTDLITNPHKIR